MLRELPLLHQTVAEYPLVVMVVNVASLTSIFVAETLTVALYQAAAAVNRSSATGCDCRTQMGRAASGERAYGSFLWAAQGGPPQPPISSPQ